MYFSFFLLYLNILLYCLILLLLVAFLVLFERNILSLFQERNSPNVVSLFSSVQTVIDGVNLLINSNYYYYISLYFILLPFISLVLSFIHWIVVPLPFEIFNGDYSVLVSFVIISCLVYVVLSSSFSSSSTYSVISSIRSVAQIISYEVVFIFFILAFLFLYNSYSWNSLLHYNCTDSSFVNIMFFFIWIVISSAELNRTPFDLVESESELVSSYNVEYSSYNFTFLFLSEYINIWFIGLIFSVLFSFSFLVFFFFFFFFVFLNIFLRSLLPRYKFYDLIILMWNSFLPFIFLFLLVYLIFS